MEVRTSAAHWRPAGQDAEATGARGPRVQILAPSPTGDSGEPLCSHMLSGPQPPKQSSGR